MKGTVEYRTALDVLRKVDAVREAMLAARHRPLASEEEQAYHARLGKVGEARDALLLAQQRAFAIWGEPAKGALQDLLLAAGSQFETFEQYFGEERGRAYRVTRGREAGPQDAETVAMGRILYAMPDAKGKDPFHERITRAAARAEEFFRARLP